ncbi:Rne/Rng family ribonuclease [Rhodoligotrophos defluvii]|uniref:Rne/Rng family ribonuclease n=1 Tax=Rhodoligotrophos defluvii TaxID=2561934 RepID=UPI0010C95593|nr:ribonuclease E/G [Rhodoligotrophos defluvii]
MGSTMLIDAAHPEETRVVVLRGNKIEEFDYESSSRKQIRGNIYLAKVTRVEPSLQAAFVDYGGNRHGFLAFSEIHPDYYQIPVADRQALLKEESRNQRASDDDFEKASEDGPTGSNGTEHANGDAASASAMNGNGADVKAGRAAADGEESGRTNGGTVEEIDEDPEAQAVDSVGSDDALEEASGFKRNVKRVYKIQEVIKRRQILLVQVVKEERGNKGAALTTYLSLAGRYCVLMPNTGRGGGISRKITDANDRRRLKEVAREMDVPEGMGVIVRTAGANRTKAEIKRDYDYLLRQWESIRDLTLKSTAPTLIYEEGSLIKRAIRDLYTKDVEQILVEGAAAHREAREFMKMLMPSHARNVKLYQEPRPLFSRYQVESQLDGLFSPTVTLSSGGYIVINQTEALVSIDVNSGKSTREHNIEDTALKTNLEAADEIARQLRLRDLAGLIVIDFIDMEEKRNNRAVERRMKEALKNDRARIQVGRISHFGLLEMSRQRLRVGMLEGSTVSCPTCLGRGVVRSIESCALSVLRGVEEHLMRRAEDVTVRCDPQVAFYLLNQKRHNVLTIEQAYRASIYLEPSTDLRNENFKVERAEGRPTRPLPAAVQVDTAFAEVAPEEAVADEELADAVAEQVEAAEAAHGGPGEHRRERNGHDAEEGGRRRRRRRGRRGGRRHGHEAEHGATATGGWVDPGAGPQPEVGDVFIPEFEAGAEPQVAREKFDRKRRSEDRHRGRHGREQPVYENDDGISVALSDAVAGGPLEAPEASDVIELEIGTAEAELAPAAPAPTGEALAEAAPEAAPAPAKRPRRSRARKAAQPGEEAATTAEPAAQEAAVDSAKAEPRRRPRAKAKAKPAAQAAEQPAVKGPEITETAVPTEAAGEAPTEAPQEPPASVARPSNGEAVGPHPAESTAPTDDLTPVPAEPEHAEEARQPEVAQVSAAPEPQPERPARRGWWQRARLFRH